MKTISFKIDEMDCPQEVGLIQVKLGPLALGEDALQFDLLKRKLSISVEDDGPTEDSILEALNQTGMTITPWTQLNPEASTSFTRINYHGIACLFSFLFIALAFAIHSGTHGLFIAAFADSDESQSTIPLVPLVFYLFAAISGAWFVVPKALVAFRNHRLDINFLMIVAVIGAGILGEWLEAATVSFLFSFAQLLESWSVDRARKAIATMLDLSPERARYRDTVDGEIREANVRDVPLKATVMVRPGERIPLDGHVSSGTTSIDQSPITGESIPVEKSTGDEVFAGTINQRGAFEFTVSRVAGDTTLARIIALVDSAQSRRAPTEQWVDKFARIYTPTVMILAVVIAIIIPLVSTQSWLDGIYQGLVVLVISCPCALVISTPVSVVSGLTSAVRAGVLIKGGAFLELPAKLQVIAMDKTGTLTEGKLTVQEIIPIGDYSVEYVLETAAALESFSDHPAAKAIVNEARKLDLPMPHAECYIEIPGKGGSGLVQGKSMWIGSDRFRAEKMSHSDPVQAIVANQEKLGRTVVILGTDEYVIAVIGIADTLRKGVSEVLAQLRSLGIKQVVMLTGDNEGTASIVAQQCGIDSYYAGLLPEEKVAIVESLTHDYQNVAMIGDGVNDAPAMAASQLGIAMGAIGTDTAIETSDVALMSDNLTRLPWLILHSRRTINIIRQNIGFAIATKVVIMILAMMGQSSLWMAIAADTGMSLLVILNGLRLLRTSAYQAE